MAIKPGAPGYGNKWYKLDNAAKIYPAISSSNRGTVFRVAAQLQTEVNPQILQEALFLILPRFPAFAVKMKKGLFWYYFEPNPNKPIITEEKAPPCRAVDIEETNGFLFRVSYYKKRISLELFHALTDGTGAMSFLKTLLYQYLSLSGCEVSFDDNVIDYSAPPATGEIEDSFKKYYNPKIKSRRVEDKAYQITGSRVALDSTRIIHGIVALKDFIRLAKEKKATITEYTAALIIYSIYVMQLKGRKCFRPVKVSVPVNLRNFFSSQTLRNFSSFVNVGLTFVNHDYSFDQVLDTVSKQMKDDIQPAKLIEKVSANVNAEQNLFMRIIPLVLKNVVLKTAFNFYGENLYTCSLSNLGNIRIPESMERHIERFEFVLGSPVINLLNCAVCSFKDNLIISFTNVTEETDIEKFFFRFLAEKGLNVIIETS